MPKYGRSKRLLAMKTELYEEIESQLEAEREGEEGKSVNTFYLATAKGGLEINFILSDSERAKIKQIDDALQRIRSSCYGVCGSCGIEIKEKRLRAMPFTQLCLGCQKSEAK